jgi:hypothetical protein
MTKINRIFLFAFFAICTLLVKGSQINNDTLRVEILLNSNILNGVQVNDKFINALDITPSQLILLSTKDKFYLLGWGGIQAVGQKSSDSIKSFAYTPDGLLMVVRNNDLCYMDSLGKLSSLFGLPNKSMGITAGENEMYVYDRNKDLKIYALYVIAKGGRYAKLFEIHTPISSIVELKSSLLFSSGNTVYNFDPKNKELKAIVALKNDKEIKSITIDTLNNMIFISSDNAVYAYKDSSLITITEKIAGTIKYFNDGLIVFDPEKKILVRMTGIESEVSLKIKELKSSSNIKQSADTLTNTNIINFVKEKLSDDSIINIISKSKVNFNLSVNSMISLSNQDVSSPVIQAMKNAMKNNNTSNINSIIVKNFYIIAGSFPTEQQANDAIADLKSKGFANAELVGKNNYGSYRIAYRSYATSEEATKDLEKIKQTTNPSAWIFKKE